MKRRNILRAYAAVEKEIVVLMTKTDRLARIASDILGYSVSAELCGGGEVEFRRIASDGVSNPDDTIRLEDILEQIND